eukprot:6498391-Lingulodinium_polyedra.AAC.1
MARQHVAWNSGQPGQRGARHGGRSRLRKWSKYRSRVKIANATRSAQAWVASDARRNFEDKQEDNVWVFIEVETEDQG